MKKSVLALSLCVATFFSLTACGTSGESTGGNTTSDSSQVVEDNSTITIDGIRSAIQLYDPDFDFNADKPMFSVIGAEDGWMGYTSDGSVVKVYQYAGEEEYDSAKASYESIIGDWPENGGFVLETNDEAVKIVFQTYNGNLDSVTVPEKPQAEIIQVGQTCTIPDLCEFTLNYAELKKEVLPPNPASFYTYYPEEDGMTYLDVSISTKNLRTTARSADEFGSVTAIVGAGYEYDGFSVIEESGGSDFTYSNIADIAPLETAVIHYLISIPNEVAEDETASITLELTMLDQDYTVSVR